MTETEKISEMFRMWMFSLDATSYFKHVKNDYLFFN